MRIAAILLSVLVAGGIGCKRQRNTDNNQPATKSVEETNRGDQSTTRSTSDYPPGGAEGPPAQPSTTGTPTGTGPAAMTGTGENTSGTGTTTTDSMGTPATGATPDAGSNQQRTKRSGSASQQTGSGASDQPGTTPTTPSR